MAEYCRRTPLVRDIIGPKQCCGSSNFLSLPWIRDGKIRIGDKYPGSATLGSKFHADPAFLVNAVSDPVLDLDTGFWRPTIVKILQPKICFFLFLSLQDWSPKTPSYRRCLTYALEREPPTLKNMKFLHLFHVLWPVLQFDLDPDPADRYQWDPKNSQHYHHSNTGFSKKNILSMNHYIFIHRKIVWTHFLYKRDCKSTRYKRCTNKLMKPKAVCVHMQAAKN